jgi:hypothetical protein
MRKLVLMAVFAALVVSLAAPDASAGRRRKNCSFACSIAESSCAPTRGVTITLNDNPCTGAYGTYSSPDTKIIGVFYEKQGGGAYQAQFKSNRDGTWQTTQVPTLQAGYYRLRVTGDSTGTTCKPAYPSWFYCSP